MKTSSFTKLNHGLIALLLTLTGMFAANQASACKASFKDSVSGKTVIFYSTSSTSGKGVSYTWVYGDGSKGSGSTAYHTYGDYSKSYGVCLYIYDSSAKCADSICTKITTGPAPCVATFTYSSAAGGVVTFANSSTSSSSVYKSSWDFGDKTSSADKNPKHTYKTAGTYKVCLTITDSANSSCTSTYCLNVPVCTITPSFTYTSSGYKVSFTSTSTTSAHTKYTWFFGDGSSDTSSGSKATHTYTTGTSYTAYLKIYDSTSKCTEYAYQTITFCSLNEVWSYSSVGLKVNFTGPTNAKTVVYSWDFGDKATGTGQHPDHTYSAAGTYNGCLTIRDTVSGCNAKYCMSVVVSSCSLVADFKYTISGTKVSFTGSATGGSTHIQYMWYFGDGAKDSTTGASVTHTYSSLSTPVNVYLFLYDSSTKCSAHIVYQIHSCSLSASYTYSASGGTVQFTAPSNPTGKYSYVWDFGDKTSSKDASPKHTYTATGKYTVCFTITDSSTGCSANYCQSIGVTLCTLTASFTDSIAGHTVYFKGTSNTTSKHVSIIWIYGDGTVDSSTKSYSASHTYAGSVSSAHVYLRVYDSTTKCIVYVDKTITFCSLTSNWHFTTNGLDAEFKADSGYSSSVTYSWDFGDKSTGSKAHTVKHTYSAAGTYTACLTVKDSSTGCTATECHSVKVSTTYCIKGQVRAGSVSGYPCIVYLITYNAKDTTLTAVDSTVITDTAGNYSFCGLSNGTYYTKAALLKKHSYYKSYIPTYHNDATQWAKAKAVVISGSDQTGVDIKMKKGTNTGGAGFVGGKISAGANKTGDPEAGVLVILYDNMQNPVAYTYTDNDGKYSFAGIEFGTYNVEVEIAGKVCHDAVVTLSDTLVNILNVNFDVNISDITLSANSGIKTAWSVENTSVYPNPVTDKLMVATSLKTAQNVNIRIYDMTGKLVYSSQRSVTGGVQKTEVDAAALPGGMYIMKMDLLKENKTLEARFMKAQ